MKVQGFWLSIKTLMNSIEMSSIIIHLGIDLNTIDFYVFKMCGKLIQSRREFFLNHKAFFWWDILNLKFLILIFKVDCYYFIVGITFLLAFLDWRRFFLILLFFQRKKKSKKLIHFQPGHFKLFKATKKKYKKNEEISLKAANIDLIALNWILRFFLSNHAARAVI